MSKSIDARVGAAGMKARNRGLSQETTAGARWSAKISRTWAGSFPSGRKSPASAASSAFLLPAKSRETGSSPSRILQ
jgi:hypothetical protein